MIEEFLAFCEEKNIKMKHVEFGRCRISREKLGEGRIFIEPKQQRLRAFEELKRPTCK